MKGIKIGNITYKISQLADDTTLFLRDVKSLKAVLDIIKLFTKVSGLLLNESKSEILQIGNKVCTVKNLFNLRWDKDKIYALGSWFNKDHKQAVLDIHDDLLKTSNTTLNNITIFNG